MTSKFIGHLLASDMKTVLGIAITAIFLLLYLYVLLGQKTKISRPSTSKRGIPDHLARSHVLHFFQLEGECQHLFNLALKPRVCGGAGRCEELAMVGERVLDLMVVKELLLRAEQVSKVVSRKKIQQWVTAEKKQYVTNEVLAKFAYHKGIDELLPSRTTESISQGNHGVSHRDLGTVCEALLGACAEIRGDVTAGAVAKKMILCIDSIVFDTLTSLFKTTGHEMFKLVRVNQSKSDYNELYIYEVSVETYPGLYCSEYLQFTGSPCPDMITAKRDVLSILFDLVWVIPNLLDPEGPKPYYLCLNPSTNTSGGKYPILQFLRRPGQRNPPRCGAPPPGSCGSPVFALDPITLAPDKIIGLYSCRQYPPQLNLHPCRKLFSSNSCYKHGGLVTRFNTVTPSPPVIDEKKQSSTRKRNKKRK